MPAEHKKNELQPLKWSFQEYTRHQRSRRWFFSAGLVMAFIMLYALLNGNFIFALIAIMITMLIVINHFNTPEMIEFELDHQGIRIGGKRYAYSDLTNFWIIYEPPQVKILYFTLKSPFKPRLSVQLEQTNPIDVRAYLRQYLEEDLDQENEPFSDALGRILKI